MATGARAATWTAAGLTLAARPEFARAARAGLRLLREQTGHDLWMVTRLDREALVVLDCLDYGYGLRPGAALPWPDTLDSVMVAGDVPRIAPRVAAVPAYAGLARSAALPVGSYAGVPLYHRGELFGTLTGLHRTALPDSVAASLPVVEAVAELLSGVIALELNAAEAARRVRRAEADAHVDPLTQLGNRLAWTKALVEEETRCTRYGRSACVVSIDLDGLKGTNDRDGHEAGDRLLREAAYVLRRVSRLCDQVARVGGDEFAVLAVEAGEAEGRVLAERLARALADAGVDASVGLAARDPDGTLETAWQAADAAMYREKRRRLQERTHAFVAGGVTQRSAPPLEIPRQARASSA